MNEHLWREFGDFTVALGVIRIFIVYILPAIGKLNLSPEEVR